MFGLSSLSTGVERYCPSGVALVIGEVPAMPFGAHPPGYSELCGKQHFLSQIICAYKVGPQSQMFHIVENFPELGGHYNFADKLSRDASSYMGNTNHTSKKIWGKTFADSPQTAKVFTLESFLA